MERNGSSRAMNLMHGAFAVGAFAGPFVIGLLMNAALSWTLVYRGISALFVLLFAVLFALPFKALADRKVDGGGAKTKEGALFRHSAYWFGFACLFLYVGVELGVSNWIAEYFVVVFGSSASAGSFMVSLFWAGLLAGRFGVPMLYKGERRDVLLLGMSILMTVSVTGLAVLGFMGLGPRVFIPAAGFAFLSGLGCSVIYPIVVTFVGGAFPHSQSEAIAFSSMGGGIGAFAFPFIMSNIAEAWGIRAGFAAYAVFSIAVIAACAGLIRGARKE
jgi:fucose permease